MAGTEGCKGGSANITEQPAVDCAVKLFVPTRILNAGFRCSTGRRSAQETVKEGFCSFCWSFVHQLPDTTLGTLCCQPALHSLCGKEPEGPAGGGWRGWGVLFVFWVYSIRIFLYRWSLVLWTYSWRNKLLQNILPNWAYNWILNFCHRVL